MKPLAWVSRLLCSRAGSVSALLCGRVGILARRCRRAEGVALLFSRADIVILFGDRMGPKAGPARLSCLGAGPGTRWSVRPPCFVFFFFNFLLFRGSGMSLSEYDEPRVVRVEDVVHGVAYARCPLAVLGLFRRGWRHPHRDLSRHMDCQLGGWQRGLCHLPFMRRRVTRRRLRLLSLFALEAVEPVFCSTPGPSALRRGPRGGQRSPAAAR